jgi:hypothetical protein
MAAAQGLNPRRFRRRSLAERSVHALAGMLDQSGLLEALERGDGRGAGPPPQPDEARLAFGLARITVSRAWSDLAAGFGFDVCLLLPSLSVSAGTLAFASPLLVNALRAHELRAAGASEGLSNHHETSAWPWRTSPGFGSYQGSSAVACLRNANLLLFCAKHPYLPGGGDPNVRPWGEAPGNFESQAPPSP